MGKCFRVRKAIFGNVNNENVMNIWNSRDYREFRSKFIKRRTQGLTMDYSIDIAPPSQCITCYRLYGVYALPILWPITPPSLTIRIATDSPNTIPKILNDNTQGTSKVITN